MEPAQTKQEIVSSETEKLILVNPADEPTGALDKAACHDGDGILHRAFSLFIFNEQRELLLQQRAADKRLWPGYWSNSCCSHPREGETMEQASARRLEQELGIRTPLRFLYKFEYQAAYRDEQGLQGSENELCWVYVGTTQAAPVINTTEIDAWRWISAAALDAELAEQAEQFTPWFHLEWRRLREDFADRLYG